MTIKIDPHEVMEIIRRTYRVPKGAELTGDGKRRRSEWRIVSITTRGVIFVVPDPEEKDG